MGTLPDEPDRNKSLRSIAMLAAFADSQNQDQDQERAEVRKVAESLGGDLNLAAVYQDLLLGRVDVASATATRLNTSTGGPRRVTGPGHLHLARNPPWRFPRLLRTRLLLASARDGKNA